MLKGQESLTILSQLRKLIHKFHNDTTHLFYLTAPKHN